MLTKSQIKLITSLGQKKFRIQHQLFIVEGVKGIKEFLNSSLELHTLFTTEAVFDTPTQQTVLVTDAELKKLSALKTPNTALAVFKIPKSNPVNENALIVALDDVRDPGNLGTIIRLCDWFGIKDLLCSKATVDCFNTKVVQATMGSLTRVNVSYLDLETFLANSKMPKFGTFMDGKNVYEMELPKQGIIVMGNEANGISKAIEQLIDQKISIPRFGNLQATESLNVATATSIFLSEFKR
ncbi:TrmH family RNA methyltransferase [Meridianimaribacter flavus]|uniref:TrmH family RNA methyltransferase n=1 Tax=Meridianimaribacter flavus TaxID=571115 RepID=A0ABY2GAG0_9FLAO|nr:RNA methyltransferase [Meridianimaribacter flavus]TDY14024.1 TrmH family RNA methyltransferase [Meridianimaribacter flavus]